MNIFVTNQCPKLSAQALDNKRVNKMIIESIQMLAYAIHHNCPDNDAALPLTKDMRPYKVSGSHKKHPCSIWTGQTRSNYCWLLLHCIELIRQKEIRYPNGRTTLHYRKAVMRCCKSRYYIAHGPLLPFVNCSMYKDEYDTILAYRKSMITKWNASNSSWSNAPHPKWIALVADQFILNER